MLKRVQILRIVGVFGLSAIILFVTVREKRDASPQRDKVTGIERKALSTKLDEKELSQDEVTSQNKPCPRAQLDESARVIYMITPTYRRAEQLPELIRTAQTLLHVKDLKWIVVEDSAKPSKEVEEYLQRSGTNFVLLTAQMPSKYSKLKNKPRGVANRNKGLEWVRNNAKTGVVYFGDDDNTYDIRLFEEIRSTKRISMFPVGLVAKQGVSSPIVKGGRIVGFFDGWIAKRKFPVDMAGFAVSVEFLLKNKDVVMPFKVGYEEDHFLQRLGLNPSDVEPKADGCTKILVWHTQTRKNDPVSESVFSTNLSETNMATLRHQVWTKK